MNTGLFTRINLITLAACSVLQAFMPEPADAQELRLSTRSAEAQSAFRAGLDAIGNELHDQAALHLERALMLDQNFAIARAFHASYAPGLPAEARATELQRAASDAMNASVGELLLVLALRAPNSERTALLRSVVDALPGDRHALLLYTASLESVADRVRGYESLIRRFPDFAPPFRQLGYLKAREQVDLDGALPLMERYLKLQPDNPHAYHGMAEVLEAGGRLTEAARHYARAIELDAKYVAGYMGLAEIALLENDGARSRSHYQQALAHERGAAARLSLQLAQAATFVVDENPRAAMAPLTRVANEAEASGYNGIAAQAHRYLAVVEAAFGNRASVDARVRKAESLSPPGNNAQRMFAAAAYALAGDAAGARPMAKALTDAASTSHSLAFRRDAQGIAALAEVSAGHNERAVKTLEQAGAAGILAKAVLAENLKRSGRRSEATTLAKEILATTATDIFALIARQKAKRI